MAASVRCFVLLVFTFVSSWSTEVKSKEQFLWLRNGESFTMQCSTSETDYDGLYLLLGLHEDKEVFFLYGNNTQRTVLQTVQEEYKTRLRVDGQLNNLKIKLSNMTVDDTGVYWCKYRRVDETTGKSERFAGSGSAMIVVDGRPCTKNNQPVLTSSLVVASAISAGSVVLLCIAVLLLWRINRKKKPKKKRRNDSVYEDMCRRTTPHGSRPPTQ